LKSEKYQLGSKKAIIKIEKEEKKNKKKKNKAKNVKIRSRREIKMRLNKLNKRYRSN